MQLDSKISTFASLGDFILNKSNQETLNSWYVQARNVNGWFTQDNCQLALQNIANEYLNEAKLKTFSGQYNIEETNTPKKIGIVAAGNIPLVGIHDIICTILSGHIALVKLSRDDTPLMLRMIEKLIEINPDFKNYIVLAERLNAADAFIATGSDNSARYFDYYFKSKPSIIRKNRTSVAILNGQEKGQELRDLGNDIFYYFGLGCRNVSKLLVPQGYNFNFFFESIQYWNSIQIHHKYNNNYDYNKSIYLVNQVPHLDSGFLLLKEDDNLVSPLAVLYYQTYQNEAHLESIISENKEKLQCIVGENSLSNQGFGKSQVPSLSDFADDIDTMKFLQTL